MSTRTLPAEVPVHIANPRRLKTFSILAVITTAAIFGQAITAGQFVSQDGRHSWIIAHGVIADLSWVMALATAAYGGIKLRERLPRLVRLAAALFLLTLAQTGIGHLITDFGEDNWIPVHVPLAFVIFGLTLWLSTWSVRSYRQAAPGFNLSVNSLTVPGGPALSIHRPVARPR